MELLANCIFLSLLSECCDMLQKAGDLDFSLLVCDLGHGGAGGDREISAVS